MKPSFKFLLFVLALSVFTASTLLSCKDVNTVGDQHFDQDGNIIIDSLDNKHFTLSSPNKIKFFVEVSGSMNGFFRANAPTDFKTDVWRVLTYYSPITEDVTVLTNDGSVGQSVPLTTFQTMMNTGAFVSSASTRVPVMLQSIIDNLNADEGEVAVLISDMKYSPVGQAAPQVLLSQYSTDISTIFGKFGKAVCLIGATSNYFGKKGNVEAPESPYYYLILGNQEQVAEMRNGISTLLSNNHHFIDNIETGFTYGAPTYSFGIPENCYLMDEKNPTFVDYDPSISDTCKIKLKVNLENYRWAVAVDTVFKEAFKCKTLYGSDISIGDVLFEIHNTTSDDKKLKRTAIAIVDLKLYNMAMDSEVVEWTLQLPDIDITKFAPFFQNATDENDVTKSFSLEDFVKGMFYGGVVNKSLKSNYILISQNS